ncbi:MAG: deaminase [Minisyncoccia bacterium]
MKNLVAYIPTINQRHLDWFSRHNSCSIHLHLISQAMAEEELTRLKRNLVAIPTEMMRSMLVSVIGNGSVSIFDPESWDPKVIGSGQGTFVDSLVPRSWVLPDEDISHLVAEKYLHSNCDSIEFEMIWARWDMTAVHKAQPVIPDVVVTSSLSDIIRMRAINLEVTKSPDWWRQIAAAVWKDDDCLAVACNTHLPTEYETYIFGDPRLNVDAGQPGKYVALHAERAVIAQCARRGIAMEGASLFVTTFPCEDCAREIAEAGIKKVFFSQGYSILNALDVLRSRDVQIIQVVETPVVA